MEGSHRSSKFFPKVSSHIALLQVFHYEVDLLVKLSIKQGPWYFQRSCVCENGQTFCFFLKKIEAEKSCIDLDEILSFVCVEDAGLADITSWCGLHVADINRLVEETGEAIVEVLLEILVKQHAWSGLI